MPARTMTDTVQLPTCLYIYHASLAGDRAIARVRSAAATSPQTFGGDRPRRSRYRAAMARKKRYLTATMPDGYVKTIGPTNAPFTHFWRIVAVCHNGKTEVFWGHAASSKEAAGKRAAAADAARQRGWTRYEFEVVELSEHHER